MLNDLTIALNTHSSCEDCIRPFFGQLEKHWPNHPHVVMGTDWWSREATPECPCSSPVCKATVVSYAAAKRFTSQYSMMLAAVETPFVLTMQEDFFLYGDVDDEHLENQFEHMDKEGFDVTCIRLIESGAVTVDRRELERVRRVHPTGWHATYCEPRLLYSMQASLWNTKTLRTLYADNDFATPWEAEVGFHRYMDQRNLRGDTWVVVGDGPRRGNHRDSTQFSYIATALVRGKWNSQYRCELEPMLTEYGIDASRRGWTGG